MRRAPGPIWIILALGLLAGLSACTSTDGPVAAIETAGQTSNPTSPIDIDAATYATPAGEGDGAELALVPPTSDQSATSTIRFMPIIGAPLEAVTPMSRRLRTEAGRLGLTVLPFQDETSAYVLKGYLSAERGEATNTVYYVWDVLDGSGNRLHRIRGTIEAEKPSQAGATTWDDIPSAAMESVAEQSLQAFTLWESQRQG